MAFRFIFYDTETTGVRSDRDRIIELAAYDPLHKRSFSRLVHPGCPIPAEASAIHHITDEMVASAPPFSQIIPEFLEFCSGEVVLVAHNHEGFDSLFLKEEFQRANTLLPNWPSVDTLKWARRYRPDLPRHTLQFLREVYEIPQNQAHRALDDVMVLHHLFSQMVDDLTPEIILKLLLSPASSKEISHMRFGKYKGTPLAELPSDYVQWLAKSGALDKAENSSLKKSLTALGKLKAS
jgi:DNA polymerase-3 subunit epsilon